MLQICRFTLLDSAKLYKVSSSHLSFYICSFVLLWSNIVLASKGIFWSTTVGQEELCLRLSDKFNRASLQTHYQEMKFQERLHRFFARLRARISVNCIKARHFARFILWHTCWCSLIVGAIILTVGIILRIRLINTTNIKLVESSGKEQQVTVFSTCQTVVVTLSLTIDYAFFL